jgi:hypothetical protein
MILKKSSDHPKDNTLILVLTEFAGSMIHMSQTTIYLQKLGPVILAAAASFSLRKFVFQLRRRTCESRLCRIARRGKNRTRPCGSV